MTALQIVATGPLALVQDLGRPGLAHLGVSRSGAADRRAHGLANRLVANPAESAVLEVTLGGFIARVEGGPITIAVTGADVRPAVDGIPFGLNSIRHIATGQTISLAMPAEGLRSYLAVRGGIAVAPVLGSRSYDTLSKIGPPPLRPGDEVPIGRPVGSFPETEQAPMRPMGAEPVTLAVIPGPRDDWFTESGNLTAAEWTVSDRCDRVGVRLAGPPLISRWPDRQLPSEGTTCGAIQVPPNGQPVILGPDHPVTGGYPVIGVITDAHTDRLAQVRPGQRLRLKWSTSANRVSGARGW